MKKFLLLVCFAVTSFFCYAKGGDLTGAGSLSVLKTKYFDILYPKECEVSARKIEAVCDGYYEQISALLDMEPYQHFPVTLTRSIDVMNAYFTPLPYNRIVLYDTVPDEELDMFDETITAVFFHELTHAVSLNVKSDGMRKLSAVISDAINPAWLSLTTFWMEGVTVSFESRGKGGRLNDPFATQIVYKAREDNMFPDWRDVTGARDTFPGGTDAYVFGAMFADYLQRTYGMEKYCEFWHRAGTSTSLSFVAGIFKKTYGKSLDSEWTLFRCKIRSNTSKRDFQNISHKKSVVSTMDSFYDSSSGITKVAYYDRASNAIRLATFNKDGKKLKNKKLLSITGVSRVSFSFDGSSLAISRCLAKQTYKNVVGEYSFKTKKYRQLSDTGVRDAYFYEENDTPALGFVSMYDNTATAGEQKFTFSEGEIPYKPVFVENNLFAAIVKNGLSWNLRLFSSDGIKAEYGFRLISEAGEEQLSEPVELIVHKLHLVSSSLERLVFSFSWAALGDRSGNFSRLGIVEIDRSTSEAKLYLQNKNISCGILECIPLSWASSENLSVQGERPVVSVFAVCSEYESNPLRMVSFYPSDFDEFSLQPSFVCPKEAEPCEVLSDGIEDESSVKIKEPAVEVQEKETPGATFKYNPLKYAFHGSLFPIGIVPVYNRDFVQNGMGILGATYITTNPWGDHQFLFSGGYNVFDKNGGMMASFSGGNTALSYSSSTTVIFDSQGFMQSYYSAALSNVLWRGLTASFSTGVEGNFLYGKEIKDEDEYDTFGFNTAGEFYFYFSNMHKASPGVYKISGIYLRPFIRAEYSNVEYTDFDFKVKEKYLNAGGTVGAKIPLFCPLSLSATLFPSMGYFAQGTARLTLFSMELQKGLPALSLYADRLSVFVSYTGKICYDYKEFWDAKRTYEIAKNVEKKDYSDEVSVSFFFTMSPNTGFFADSANCFDLGATWSYRPNPKPDQTKSKFKIFISMDL